MDLAERLEALASRNAEPLPDDTPSYSDAEAKDVFLSRLEEGKTIPEAAKLAGRTASWFRHRRTRGNRVYDVDFSLAYDEIMAPDGSHREGLGLRGLTNLAKASDDGNVRASEKLMAAYHGDFGWMKTQAAQGALNVEQLQVFFGELPLEKLLELKQARESARRELPPVIDQ